MLAPEGRRSIALGPASGPWSPARTPCSGRSLSTSGRLSSDRQSAARQNGDARRIGERHPHPGETMTIDNHPHYIEDPNATTPPPQVELVGSVPTPPMPSPSEAMTIQVTLPRAAQAARPTGTPVQLSATWSKGEMIFELEGVRPSALPGRQQPRRRPDPVRRRHVRCSRPAHAHPGERGGARGTTAAPRSSSLTRQPGARRAPIGHATCVTMKQERPETVKL